MWSLSDYSVQDLVEGWVCAFWLKIPPSWLCSREGATRLVTTFGPNTIFADKCPWGENVGSPGASHCLGCMGWAWTSERKMRWCLCTSCWQPPGCVILLWQLMLPPKIAQADCFPPQVFQSYPSLLSSVGQCFSFHYWESFRHVSVRHCSSCLWVKTLGEMIEQSLL